MLCEVLRRQESTAKQTKAKTEIQGKGKHQEGVKILQ